MRDGPIDSSFGGPDGDFVKTVLFQLMAGFCAHVLPF
jgi:hypothetical protein